MKLAVFGDTHLGFKQYGFAEREQDFVTALLDVASSCTSNGVKTVISTGDLFNNPKPAGELVYQVKTALEPFCSLGIDGNHDIANSNWLRLCGVHALDKCVLSLNDDGNELAVAGLNWVRPSSFMETLDKFLAGLPAGTTIDVFVLHQLLDEFISYKQNQISAATIAEKLRPFNVRAVLMGDLHETINLNIGGIEFIYTGSTEVNSLGEKYDKSFVMLDVPKDRNKPVTFQRYPIKTRPFIHKFIQTEKELDELLVEYVHTPTDRKAFLILEYDNEGKELAHRAEAALKDKALFRLIPIVKSAKKSLTEQLSAGGFERTDALGYLKKSITAFFVPETDEYQLILQLLEMPEEVDRIITAYAKGKGLV